jgi:uncharacterized protein (DUF952 family)
MILYHVTTQSAWSEALEQGVYHPDSLKNEGFIHCATKEQLPGVLQRYFQGQKDLVLLTIETDSLTAPLVWENTTGGQEKFPHLYGPITPGPGITMRPWE